MTPEVLLAVMVPIWLGLLAGLWRAAVRLEQTDRLMEGLGDRSAALQSDRSDDRRG